MPRPGWRCRPPPSLTPVHRRPGAYLVGRHGLHAHDERAAAMWEISVGHHGLWYWHRVTPPPPPFQQRQAVGVSHPRKYLARPAHEARVRTGGGPRRLDCPALFAAVWYHADQWWVAVSAVRPALPRRLPAWVMPIVLFVFGTRMRVPPQNPLTHFGVHGSRDRPCKVSPACCSAACGLLFRLLTWRPSGPTSRRCGSPLRHERGGGALASTRNGFFLK